MKKLLGVVVLTLIWSQSLLAQDKIWQFELKFKGETSKEAIEKSIPAFAYAFYEPFIKGSGAFKQVSIFTSANKIKSVVNQSQLLVADRVKKHELTYTLGDDVITEDVLAAEFPLLSDQKNAAEGYMELKNLAVNEQVAGVSCTKAQLKIVDPHVGEVEMIVWYTQTIPSYYLNGLPFLRELPGAVLKFQDVVDSTLTFEASEIHESADSKVFDLPKTVKVVNLSKQVETHESEETNLFEDSFRLKAPLKWFSQKDAAFGDDYLFGVKNESGTVLYPANFYSIDVLNEDHAIVSDTENEFWIINNQAKKINQVGFDVLYAISQENMVYAIEDKFGIINASGVSVIGGLENISSFVGHYLLYTQNHKQGLLDFNGQVVLKPTLDFIDTNEKGNVIVTDSQDGGALKEYSLDEFQKKYLHK